MRAWLAIIAAVLAVAGAVYFASESQRSIAEENFNEARLAEQLRGDMLDGEVALDQGVAGSGAKRLPDVETAVASLNAGLRTARGLSRDDPLEMRQLAGQQRALAAWEQRSADEIAILRAGRLPSVRGVDDRLVPLRQFLAANDAYQARLDAKRHEELRSAEMVPVFLIIGLSALFLVAGVLVVRRTQHTKRLLDDEAKHRRERELQFAATQRRLSEALQVAANQREAHGLLTDHLQRTILGSAIHILNRNNSADRLESTTDLPEDSPLAEALVGSEPRSCIAVRLSRPFERGPHSEEVLTCEICGRLEGDSTCRPLLVGGEVIGSVLVERDGGLVEDEERRIDESVTSAAPVLANLRNLAIAEMRAATDALTGLPNRRSLDDTLKRMLAQAGRTMQPLTVLQLDLDHFKQINDTFGHERGDNALAAFGAMLRSGLRASDFAARAGGEEFVVLLPNTDRQGGLQLAEKLRHSVHAVRVEGVDRSLTVSIGVATFPDDAVDEDTLLRLGDRALYTAKQHGRDRVEAVSQAGGDPETESARS